MNGIPPIITPYYQTNAIRTHELVHTIIKTNIPNKATVKEELSHFRSSQNMQTKKKNESHVVLSRCAHKSHATSRRYINVRSSSLHQNSFFYSRTFVRVRYKRVNIPGSPTSRVYSMLSIMLRFGRPSKKGFFSSACTQKERQARACVCRTHTI